MNKEELIILANKSKEIGIAISEWNENDFNHISIDTEGNIYANFSRYCWGEKDEEDIYIDEEDINSPIETTIVKYQKLAQEKEELAKAAKLLLVFIHTIQAHMIELLLYKVHTP